MSGHTPGPWTFYDDSNDGKTNRIEIVAIGKTIAHIYHSVPAKDLPNARLIAAAPELLEALEAICDEFDNDDDFSARQIAWHAGRAAIAKAKGEA